MMLFHEVPHEESHDVVFLSSLEEHNENLMRRSREAPYHETVS